MRSAVTISLVPEMRGGPFVYADDLATGCIHAAKLGFDAVEIFPASAEVLDVAAVEKLVTGHGLKVAAVGTGAGWVKQKLRLTDPDESIRRQAREFIGRMVKAAGLLGASTIVGSMQGRWGDGVTREQALAWLRAALDELGELAASHRVPLLYEALNRYETNLFNRQGEAAAFLRSLRTRNVKLLCDLFHMNIEEASLPEALRAAGPLVGHVHLADSNRQAIGFGHTDMAPIAAVLKEIKFAGYLSAEILPLPDSATAARQTLASFKKWFR